MPGESLFLRNLETMLMTEAESESSKSSLESVQPGNPGKGNFAKGVLKKKNAVPQILNILRTEA